MGIVPTKQGIDLILSKIREEIVHSKRSSHN